MRLTAADLRKIAACCRDPRWRQAVFRHRTFAGAEHGPLLRRLHRAGCRTILDVGANRGQFALAARRLCPEARVIAFEPLSRPAARFRALFAGDPAVTLHEVALGDRRESPRRARMHVAARDDSSSLRPITGRQTRHFPGTHAIGEEEVLLTDLDTLVLHGAPEPLLRPPVLLKIDVQGYELPVLRGARDVLRRVRWLYIECSFEELYEGQELAGEVVAWLARRKFRLTEVAHPVCRKGRVLQADLLFEPEGAR